MEERHIICDRCKIPFSSNQRFGIHKSCNIKLPSEFIHPRHPNHQLSLTYSLYGQCSLCNYPLSGKRGCNYRCKTCPSFTIDFVCAMVFLKEGFGIEHESHPQHPLQPIIEETLFFCQACGTKHQDRPLICNCCGFWIARSCAELWLTHQISEYDPYRIHHHDLKLKYSQQQLSIDSDDRVVACGVCAQPINSTFWTYCCKECRYYAHVRCATLTTEPFMSILHPVRNLPADDILFKDTVRLPVQSESTNFVRYRGEKKEGSIHYLKDPRHHDLILQTNQEVRKEESNPSLCNGCIQPITLPFYSCNHAKCSFSIHDKCYSAAMRRTSWARPKINLEEFFGIFICDCCHRPSNGVMSTYPGIYDLKCEILPRYIVHESHPKHRLRKDTRRYGPCPCCLFAGEDQEKFIYRCEMCSFNLHQKCANYPSTVRHRYDKHPLMLTYKPIKGSTSDEYYCEICELEVNHLGWFYHCIECDQSFHVDCIPQLDHWSNIKFGGILKLNCHVHPLTFDRFILDRPCQHCDKTIDSMKDGMAFQCKECPRYQIHFECAKSLSEAEGKDTKQTIFESWDTGNPYYNAGGETIAEEEGSSNTLQTRKDCTQ